MLLKIIVDSYKPNTAQTNRLLALAKGLVENGLKVEVVFVHPGMKSERLTNVPVGMTVRYLWDGHPLKNKYFARLLGFIDVIKFAKRLEKGDNVLLIGDGQFLPILLKRKNIRVFHERSEHPDVVKVLPHFLQYIFEGMSQVIWNVCHLNIIEKIF